MDFLSGELSKKTIVFGLKLWAVIGVGVGVLVVLILFFLLFWLGSRRKAVKEPVVHARKGSSRMDRARKPLPQATYGGVSGHTLINESDQTTATDKAVVHVNGAPHRGRSFDRTEKKPLTRGIGRTEGEQFRLVDESNPETANKWNSVPVERVAVDLNKKGDNSHDKASSSSSNSRTADSPIPPCATPLISVPEVSHLGWGHWYTLRELEAATDSFSDANVLGEGGYGILYYGQLPDGTRIAAKNLLNNRGQAEREFKVEVEAIGRVRHKNLVRLIGYCMEGSQRILVYEYVDNGNLEQWLHGSLGEHSSLSWDIRMKIILGTAKGMAYLHEGLEPKIVHRDIKSSNILLDSQWNPKISDFGLAKLLGAGNSHVTTRVMGTFGYVAPEYALTGMLTDKSDVYSYGVLLMELVTGRVPVDFSRRPEEVNLIDWLKTMVGDRRIDEVIDPKMTERPTPRALKRTLLAALRCVDPDAQKRPKMGQIVHMLESEDNAFREECKSGRHHVQANLQKKMDGARVAPTYRQNHKDTQKRGNASSGNKDNGYGGVDPQAEWRYEG